MTNHISKFLYWSPRILAILFILFLAMFSLDVFDGNYGFRETIGALLIHNIPSIILLIITIIARKNELVGAIVFSLFGIFYITQVSINGQLPWYTVLSWSMIIAGPALATGILFFFNRRKRHQKLVSI